jgi:two-component system response regulator PilR (NtrC family)
MNPELKILVVDDNQNSADALVKLLVHGGNHATAVYNGADAINWIQASPVDVILTDLRMEPIDGMEVLRAAQAQTPPIRTIVFTAYGDINVAVEAMHMGADDFLTKPVRAEQLEARLQRIRKESPSMLGFRPANIPLVMEAPASKALLELMDQSSKLQCPIWLEGEFGSGRFRMAHTLHQISGQDGPIEILDIDRFSGWPQEGILVAANVDSWSVPLQKKLIRLLPSAPTHVRIVATATPQDTRYQTQRMVLPELFHSLGVLVISIPPIRNRVEDIEPIFSHALNMFSQSFSKPCPSLSAKQKSWLRQYSWPGNIREIINLAERVIVTGPDAIDIAAHNLHSDSDDTALLTQGFSLANYLDQMEKKVLVAALNQADGDRGVVGQLLGVERNALRYKLNKYGLLD